MSTGNFTDWYWREHFDYFPTEETSEEEFEIFENIKKMIYESIDSEDCDSIIRKEEILTKILSTFHKTKKEVG